MAVRLEDAKITVRLETEQAQQTADQLEEAQQPQVPGAPGGGGRPPRSPGGDEPGGSPSDPKQPRGPRGVTIVEQTVGLGKNKLARALALLLSLATARKVLRFIEEFDTVTTAVDEIEKRVRALTAAVQAGVSEAQLTALTGITRDERRTITFMEEALEVSAAQIEAQQASLNLRSKLVGNSIREAVKTAIKGGGDIGDDLAKEINAKDFVKGNRFFKSAMKGGAGK